MTFLTSNSTAVAHCRVVFGVGPPEISPADTHALHVDLPVLAGGREEVLLPDVGPLETHFGFPCFRSGQRVAGFALAASSLALEAAAADLYRRLFAATQGLQLQRIWNYIPDINAVVDGLENYRRFCRGRSLAFEERFGPEFQHQLPAASGVGCLTGPLAVAFVAGTGTPRHFENPEQVPAFHYPSEYGPRPPSFSRATLVELGPRARQLFISGTAAIRGHATVATGDLARQLDCTVENLRLIGQAAGAGPDVGRAQAWSRSFKVYLRHAEDLTAAQAQLERLLLQPADAVSYLHADLCRADLLVEIEAVLTR